MALVLFTPPTYTQSWHRHPGETQDEHNLAKFLGSRRVGYSLYKVGPTWFLKKSPSVNDVEGATYYFVGGHWYYVEESILDEIANQGIDIGWTPDPHGTWPSIGTYPASNTYPGVL
jgi:hypothetical protein